MTSRDEMLEYAQEMAMDPEASKDVVELQCANCQLENDDIAVLATVFEMGGFANLRVLDLSSRCVAAA